MIRIQKTVRLAPGLRLRLTPRGGSMQAGGSRARATLSRRGIGVGLSLLPGVSWFRRLSR